MKNALYLLFLILFISCSENRKKNLQEEIKSKIKFRIDDPSSFDFVDFRIDSTSSRINKLITPLAKLNYKYDGSYTFRAKNKFGAIILVDYYFKADSTYKLIYLLDNINDTIYTDVDVLMEEMKEEMKDEI